MKTETTLRMATRADQAAVVAIMNEAIRNQKNAYIEVLSERADSLWYSALLSKANALMVVELSEKVVGWGSLTPYRSGRNALRHVAEISFYIASSFQRKGLGTHMINALEEHSKSIGLTHLLAILLADNHHSKQLLSKLGYEQWALLPDIVSHVDGRKSHMYMGKSLV